MFNVAVIFERQLTAAMMQERDAPAVPYGWLCVRVCISVCVSERKEGRRGGKGRGGGGEESPARCNWKRINLSIHEKRPTLTVTVFRHSSAVMQAEVGAIYWSPQWLFAKKKKKPS